MISKCNLNRNKTKVQLGSQVCLYCSFLTVTFPPCSVIGEPAHTSSRHRHLWRAKSFSTALEQPSQESKAILNQRNSNTTYSTYLPVSPLWYLFPLTLAYQTTAFKKTNTGLFTFQISYTRQFSYISFYFMFHTQ